MPSDYSGWKEVHSREDLPWIGTDCLFELRNGWRFYGYRETGDVICAPLWGEKMRRIEWMHVKKWIPKNSTFGLETGGDGREEGAIGPGESRRDSKISTRGRPRKSQSLSASWSTHLTHGSSTD